MSTTTPERLLKRNRRLRWLEIILLLALTAQTMLDAVSGHMLEAFMLAVATLLTIGALRLNARTTARLERQCRPPAARLPRIMERRPEPVCPTCDSEEGAYRGSALFGFSITPRYEAHRDCWVTTGSEKELERMLRHVTWESS